MNVVYLGADHKGYRLKNIIREWMNAAGLNCTDLGNKEYNVDDDYTDIAILLAEKIVSERTKGILICGSGVGVCVAANKVKGVRAGMGINERQVRIAREDDDINVLCLAAEAVGEEENQKMIKVFLETVFVPSERHMRRINKIKKYETT